jgi:hypothetical protein
MAFANPSLTAETHRPLTYFISLPIAYRGQGKEMPFFQKTLQKVSLVKLSHKFLKTMPLQQVIIKNTHKKQEVDG